MDKFIKLPANDVPSWVGFVVMVILVIAIARKVPGLKSHV